MATKRVRLLSSRQGCPIIAGHLAPRIVKGAAKRSDRTWRSREEDDTYGSRAFDQAGADRGLSQPATPRTRIVTDNWFLAFPTGKRQRRLKSHSAVGPGICQILGRLAHIAKTIAIARMLHA
jgi:hypothetical protein